MIMLTLLFIFSEWLQRNKEHPLQMDSIIKYRPVRWGIYYVITGLILIFSGGSQPGFIYAQF